VVFTTAHKEHAIKAIRSGAFDYILKPIAINDLSDMLKRLEVHLSTKSKETAKAMPAAEDENTTKQTSKLVIPTANGYSLENKELIIYCEGMGNYTKIYLSTGKEMIMSKTLKTIELSLGDSFCRIHKSYLVNNNHILRYSRSNGYKITLTNDTVLDVSYRNNEKVLQILKKISH
jgi:two-component system LytT family response regulator